MQYTSKGYGMYLIPPAQHTGMEAQHPRGDVEPSADYHILMISTGII